MSKNSTLATPVKFLRSFLFLMAAVCSIVIFLPMTSYAEGAEVGTETEDAAEAGETEEVEQPEDKTHSISLDIIHEHAGNRSKHGGCFRNQTTSRVDCDGKCFDYERKHIEAPEGYGLNYTSYGLRCNVCDYVIWFENLSSRYTFHRSHGDYAECPNAIVTTVYDPACGMENKGVVGKLTLTSSTTEWTDHLTLTASYEADENLKISDAPFIWNGQETSAETVFEVTENGDYTLGLAVPEDVYTQIGTLTMNISNIDYTKPVIEAVTYDQTQNVNDVTLSVTAGDTQPDGSAGSGLHPEAYSYDGGNTWTSDPTYRMDQNGTVVIAVRDLVGNTEYWTQDVTNIDSNGPEISYQLSENGWTNKDIILYLSSQDKNSDGSAGIGIPKKWYSLDGGNTWSDEEEVVFDKNEDVTVTARDNNDNRSELRISINRIDKELPWVTLSSQIIEDGLDKKAILTAEAGDGESGLPEEAFSWDKGCSYGSSDSLTVTEDGVYQVTVRDKAGNWNYEQVEVSGISFIPILPVPEEIPVEETTEENDEESEDESENESTEESTETILVLQEERIDEPEAVPVTNLKEERKWDWKDTVVLASASLLTLGTGAFLFIMWLWTIAVYAEDADGKMKYIGRLWIRYADDGFEVTVDEMIFDQCTTTHFLLRPSRLFVRIHEGKEISCLFPESVCVIKQINRTIEISLL